MITPLAQLTARGETLEFDGATYTISPLTARDWAEIHQRIIDKRPDPVEAAARLARGQPPEVARPILERAYEDAKRRKVVTANELDEFRNTLEGRTFEFYLAVRHKHPDMTPEDADALLELATERMFTEALAELQTRFPDVTRAALLAAAKTKEEGAMAEMIGHLEAIPEGNPPAPETPGQEISPSTSPDGIESSDASTDGLTSKSAT